MQEKGILGSRRLVPLPVLLLEFLPIYPFRHLTTSQRAAIAAESVPMLREEAKKRQATSGPGTYGGKPLMPKTAEAVSSNPDNNIQKGSARDIAAKAAGVGHDTVQKAMDIKKKDPEVYKRVKSGEITVGQAHRALKGDNSTKRKDQLKNAGKRRMGCPQKHLFLAGRYRPIPHTRNQGLGRAAATGFLTGWRSL